MGNSTSSQRREQDLGQVQPSGPNQNRRLRSSTTNDEGNLRLVRRRTDAPRTQLSSGGNGLVTTTAEHSRSIASLSQAQSGSPHDDDNTAFEGDDRPLFMPENTNFEAGRPTNSLGRSTSTMSRLGSRLLPDTVVRSLLSSGEETAEEGEALRQGVASRRRTSVWERTTPASNSDRFSISGTIRRHMESRAESRRRSIRGPFPLGHSEHQLLQGEPTNTLGLESAEMQTRGDTNDEDGSTSRRNRLSRVRNSLSFPISNLFPTSRDRQTGRNMPRASTPHPGRVSPFVVPDHLLPSATRANLRSNDDEAPHELEAVEPEGRNLLSSSRITSGMSTIRRFPHGFRSRSRLIRRGEHPPLSQVLQLAAAAIAAQLGGQSGPGGDGLPTLGGEAFDGSIQNFVQTLQEAASAQAGGDIDMNATDGDLPPVNFMRVFQFPNDENGTPMPHAQTYNGDHLNSDSGVTSDGDRSVTLVLVGVRSMPSPQDAPATEHGGIVPSLDTLLNLPFLPPATMLNNGTSGALFRRADTRARANRRHSLTNFNFPAQYESQRHHRSRSTIRRSTQEPTLSLPNQNVPTPVSESPPGPHPPPSTPADVRSGQVTPIRRPSSASGVPSPSLPNLDEDLAQTQPIPPAEQSSNTLRQRRRSDSEFARRPELSSGAARRNGMVEPDRPTIGPGRSWLIYVVGTNVSPDHPAFTMPSLFTDNPTYEDMQMLSTLLGPVKPPVASQDDINTAGGVYRIQVRNNALVAEPLNGVDSVHTMTITKGDRCLICLCEYETADEVRQLGSCRHVFHRECIDEWLTTGRNSCPMCRGQGVQENSASSSVPVVGEASS